jgi:peptidyl-prolyl cis-trans isomerase A (cyclophilin A)
LQPVRVLPLAALALAVVVLALGCGGSGGSSSGPPAALLHPSKLDAKAPQLFDVTFKTTKGTFVVSVHRTWAPVGAARFYNLVKAHFYDNVRIFRVLPHFVAQFGISPYPQVSKAFAHAFIPDDPHTVSNTRGTVTFATAGANTRTTQLFVNLGDNRPLDLRGFTPIGSVTSGLDVVDKLYSGYGDRPTGLQAQMEKQGNAFLDKRFPKLDHIITARVTDESNPALP